MKILVLFPNRLLIWNVNIKNVLTTKLPGSLSDQRQRLADVWSFLPDICWLSGRYLQPCLYMDLMLGSHTRVRVLPGQGRLPSFTVLSQVERFRLRSPRSLLAQPVVSAIWRFHLRSSDIVTPRYFVWWTDSRLVCSIVYWYVILWVIFRVMCIIMHLLGSKHMHHSLAQDLRWSRSLWSWTQSWLFAIGLYQTRSHLQIIGFPNQPCVLCHWWIY